MDFLNRWLQKRCDTGNYRRLFPLERFANGQIRKAGSSSDSAILDFSSNDYLALSIHPDLIAAARDALNLYGTGAGAARLMSGDLQLYHSLEEATAKFKNREAALLFGSGYMANIGVIPALVGRGDVIFSDRLNHASIYDGCRLAGAKLVRFHHNDLDHLEDCLKRERGQGKALIIVESVYSMDGDRCPLGRALAEHGITHAGAHTASGDCLASASLMEQYLWMLLRENHKKVTLNLKKKPQKQKRLQRQQQKKLQLRLIRIQIRKLLQKQHRRKLLKH